MSPSPLLLVAALTCSWALAAACTGPSTSDSDTGADTDDTGADTDVDPVTTPDLDAEGPVVCDGSYVPVILPMDELPPHPTLDVDFSDSLLDGAWSGEVVPAVLDPLSEAFDPASLRAPDELSPWIPDAPPPPGDPFRVLGSSTGTRVEADGTTFTLAANFDELGGAFSEWSTDPDGVVTAIFRRYDVDGNLLAVRSATQGGRSEILQSARELATGRRMLHRVQRWPAAATPWQGEAEVDFTEIVIDDPATGATASIDVLPVEAAPTPPQSRVSLWLAGAEAFTDDTPTKVGPVVGWYADFRASVQGTVLSFDGGATTLRYLDVFGEGLVGEGEVVCADGARLELAFDPQTGELDALTRTSVQGDTTTVVVDDGADGVDDRRTTLTVDPDTGDRTRVVEDLATDPPTEIERHEQTFDGSGRPLSDTLTRLGERVHTITWTHPE